VENSIARLLSSLKEHFNIRKCNVLVRPLGNSAAARRKNAGVSYRLLSAEDLERFCADPGLELSDAFVRAASARGDVCVGAFEATRPVGYAWLAFAAAPYEDSVWVKFDLRACYTYKAFVRAGWEGRDIDRALRIVADDLCIWSGKSFAISFIDSRNQRSLAEARRTGAQTVATAGYMEPIGMNWALRSPGAERFEFSFFKPH
jgi:hypothetical protein